MREMILTYHGVYFLLVFILGFLVNNNKWLVFLTCSLAIPFCWVITDEGYLEDVPPCLYLGEGFIFPLMGFFFAYLAKGIKKVFTSAFHVTSKKPAGGITSAPEREEATIPHSTEAPNLGEGNDPRQGQAGGGSQSLR